MGPGTDSCHQACASALTSAILLALAFEHGFCLFTELQTEGKALCNARWPNAFPPTPATKITIEAQVPRKETHPSVPVRTGLSGCAMLAGLN